MSASRQAGFRWQLPHVAGGLGAALACAGWLVWWTRGASEALVAAALGSVVLAVGLFLTSRTRPGAGRAADPPAQGGPAPETPPEPVRGAQADYESILYSISHDLRSPLGAVLNYAAILEEDYGEVLDREGLHMLSRVRSSAGTAMDRVDSVLELTRVARREPDRTPLDMAKLVTQAASQVVDPSIRLDLRPLPEVCADRELMLRVWTELLANASEHCMAAKDPAIVVDGSLDGHEAIFAVTDNGEGFDMRFEAKLFRPFERLHAATESSGVGMGLAMAAAILRRHGGWISAESAPEQGATFRFGFPRSTELAP